MSTCFKKVTWISIVGARPQFIKLSPVSRVIQAHNQAGEAPAIEHKIIHTGQHYDPEMADLIIEQLGIPAPHYNLGVGSGSHQQQLARMLERIEPVLLREQPNWVVIYGDTNSALAGALAGARLGISVAHVEAGCRSYNERMPEEQNRVLVDHLSRLLLAPSQCAVENLKREGIGAPNDPRQRTVTCVGDVMYDAFLAGRSSAENLAPQILERFRLQPRQYYLLTLHRAANTTDSAQVHEILNILQQLDLPVLFPVHPRTHRVLSEGNVCPNGSNIQMVRPLGYFEILAVGKYARTIITDSGGLQKEAFYLNVPCITLREETEWPETVSAGANWLVTHRQRGELLQVIRKAKPHFESPGFPFGQGNAATSIVNALLSGSPE